MSKLLRATREKAKICRENGNDIAAAEYESYANHIAELEALLDKEPAPSPPAADDGSQAADGVGS